MKFWILWKKFQLYEEIYNFMKKFTILWGIFQFYEEIFNLWRNFNEEIRILRRYWNFMRKLKLGRIFPHDLAYPDQNAEKSCKGGGGGGEGEELSRIEHAAKQQLITLCSMCHLCLML